MAKNHIMESLFKLKSLLESIAHDMTRKERDERKALVEQAKLKSEAEQGEWVYRVRGPPARMKVVQLRKTCQTCHKEVFNDSMFEILYTNADGLPNKLHKLKLLMQSHKNIVAVTEIKHKKISGMC